MPIGIEMKNCFHVGATPRWTFSVRTWGESTSTAPISTSSSWVAKSISASRMLSPADSLTPRTLTSESSATTAMPKMTSDGPWRSASTPITLPK